MARVPRDGCIVPAEPFVELVREFIARWNRDRPQPGGQFGLDEEAPIRPLAWLSAETGFSEGTIEGLLEQNGDRKKDFIELRLADEIAVALDCPYIFSDPRVEGQIVANPAATERARLACCSGSEHLAAA